MAKLHCCCGERLYLSGHSKYEFLLFNSKKMNDFYNKMNENKNYSAEFFYDNCASLSTLVYICDKCGRIYIDYDNDRGMVCYNIEK